MCYAEVGSASFSTYDEGIEDRKNVGVSDLPEKSVESTAM